MAVNEIENEAIRQCAKLSQGLQKSHHIAGSTLRYPDIA